MDWVRQSWKWLVGIVVAFALGAIGGSSGGAEDADAPPDTVTVTVPVEVEVPTTDGEAQAEVERLTAELADAEATAERARAEGEDAGRAAVLAEQDGLANQIAEAEARLAELSGEVAAAEAAAPQPFGDGVWLVGADIAPGTYRSLVPASSRNCYWARLSGAAGDFDDILANSNVDSGAQALVTIADGDVAFETAGCGTWEPAG